jgi:hypothetical protein
MGMLPFTDFFLMISTPFFQYMMFFIALWDWSVKVFCLLNRYISISRDVTCHSLYTKKSLFLNVFFRKEPRKKFLLFGTCYNIFSLTNSATVSLCTPRIRAMALFDTRLSNSVFISVSLPVSFLTFDLLPFGRPSITPSVFFRARASLVRWKIRLRSISADNPKAKARILELMSLPKR